MQWSILMLFWVTFLMDHGENSLDELNLWLDTRCFWCEMIKWLAWIFSHDLRLKCCFWIAWMLEEIEYRKLAVSVGKEIRYTIMFINQNLEKVWILDKFNHFWFGSILKLIVQLLKNRITKLIWTRPFGQHWHWNNFRRFWSA